MNKKGAIGLGEAPSLALTLGLVVLISAAVGLSVQSFRSGLTADTAAYNISTTGLTGITNFTGQMPTIGTVLGVALIIGIVVAAFAFGKQGGSSF